MKSSVLGLVCVFALGLLCAPIAEVDGACGQRVRKSYDRLTVDEKRLYRRALQKSMDAGYYIKFVEMHTEKMSEMEAHRVCMFTYWHRYFLLGFENMLRSLGPEFKCITVPYWDQIQQNARAMTGACSSMESCTPMIRDWGGSTKGVYKNVVINGVEIGGSICVTGSPLDRFCEASSRKDNGCAKCLPRDNLQQQPFPAMANYASVYRQLFAPQNLPDASESVEEGMHNAIHATLGSTMGTFQSPADPIFWSHHAYVDLLLTIFLKCRAGLGKLSDAQKANNPYTFVSCPKRENTGMFIASSKITMRNGESGANPIQANAPNSPLYAFFKDIPDQYALLSDIITIGGSSRYTYQVGGLVGQLALNCDKPPSGRRLGEYSSGTQGEAANATRVRCESGLNSDDDAKSPPSSPENAPFQVDSSYDNDVHAKKVTAWVHEVTELLRKLPEDKSREPVPHAEVVEMERMVCMFQDQCRGGVADYSDEFKKAFGVTKPPPCKTIVDEINECRPLRLSKWKETMEKYFPCNVALAAAPTDPDTNETPIGDL
ncbi:hypothetical protein PybrP1_000119 [[Pythium] brassicae (nom. inval.)]|nr:hypothetical protein PybrP1_000119 [[Pythium] brassicae (nom. inval.)]